MDLKKEAFEFGNGTEYLAMVFSPDIAREFINKLSLAIRPKDQNGLGYTDSRFYLVFGGKCISQTDHQSSSEGGEDETN